MTTQVNTMSPRGDIEVEAQKTAVDHYDDIDEKVNYDRAGAIDAENVEHNMGVLEAVRAYPAASWWAFVMSCTIVSSQVTHHSRPIPSICLIIQRSWRLTAFS